jgi:hypothetical protein
LELGHILDSVEATIFLRVGEGSWPDGFRAQFVAFATDIRWKGLGWKGLNVDHMRIILLDFGSRKVLVTGGDGGITLSRRVVSVETTGKLRVFVKAWDLGGLEIS